MQKRISKSLLAFGLAFAMVLSLLIGFMPSVSLAAATQSEIDALKQQKNALSSKVSEYESTIAGLRSKKASQLELKKALDEKLDLTNQQMVNLMEQIDLHDKLIEQKTEEVKDAQEVADKQLERYKKRIRAMEEAGRYNYLEVLFGANSIGEFLSLIDDIGDIMKSDEALERSYRESVENLKSVKAEYEKAQAEMKENKAELALLKDTIQKDISEAQAAITALQADIQSNAQLRDTLSAERSQLSDQIQAKVNELEAQRKAEEAANKPKPSGGGSATGSGKLVWPSYSTYISSRQGPRVHPVTGEYKNHGGVDVGASYGTAIYAADSGTVVVSSDGWNGGWGNYVQINHGNGKQTLYAHMSSRAVSTGSTVSAGQVIGYVGSSGMSTGPHLHFEMYVNGGRVNPLSYYSGISFTFAADA